MPEIPHEASVLVNSAFIRYEILFAPMRLVIQRVSEASVTVDSVVTGRIGPGLMILCGIECDDTAEDAAWLVQKVAQMRIFSDAEGKMNLSVKDIGGGVLVVSQFTLAAELADGNRPSFSAAEDPAIAERLYLRVADRLRECGLPTATGRFGAKMEVTLCNDGPVTFVLCARDGRVQRRATRDPS